MQSCINYIQQAPICKINNSCFTAAPLANRRPAPARRISITPPPTQKQTSRPTRKNCTKQTIICKHLHSYTIIAKNTKLKSIKFDIRLFALYTVWVKTARPLIVIFCKSCSVGFTSLYKKLPVTACGTFSRRLRGQGL